MRRLIICTVHPKFSSSQIKKNEMGGACSAYGGKERCLEGFGGEILENELPWETQA